MSQKSSLPALAYREESQQYYIIAPYNIKMLEIEEINPPRESHSLTSITSEMFLIVMTACSLAYLSSQFRGLNLKLSLIFFAHKIYLS